MISKCYFNIVSFIFTVLLLGGCAAKYTTPAGGVSISDLTDESIEELLKVEPASPFPARITVVRVQAPGYISMTNTGYGTGRYSVITIRDVESDADFEKISALPMVSDVARINRLFLSPRLGSLKALREAAARLKTDLMLLYTIDTAFRVESRSLGPLSTISLGMLPNKKARVTSTTSGALIDVRTGYIYGVLENTKTEEQRTNMWNRKDAIDKARLKSEKASFQGFIDEYEDLWRDVINRYARSS
jgi:hypothetical protein